MVTGTALDLRGMAVLLLQGCPPACSLAGREHGRSIPFPDTGRISHFTTPRVPDAPSSAHAGPSLEGKLAAVTWGFTVLRQMEDRRTLWMTTALQSNSGALSGWALNAGPNSCIVVLRRLSP